MFSNDVVFFGLFSGGAVSMARNGASTPQRMEIQFGAGWMPTNLSMQTNFS